MLSFLKNHPFGVEAFFKRSIVLTFAVPKEEVEHLIPECLTLDLHNDEWAFVAVALVQTEGLRPKAFPKFLSNNFFLIGYRVFVKYTNVAGKRLRGLYILKSETDRNKMSFFGNIFTHYNYTTTDIEQTKKANTANTYTIQSIKSGLKIEMETVEGDTPLPRDSPFADWKEARRFAGPLPFTFTYNSEKNEILIIEGVRQNWVPKPVKIIDYNISFLNSLNLKGSVLANAFLIKDIPYHWKKGRIEQWKR